MSVKELRGLELPQLLHLMASLGLSTVGVTERASALTRLMETAVEA